MPPMTNFLHALHDQIIRRLRSNSDLARTRLGRLRREGSDRCRKLDIHLVAQRTDIRVHPRRRMAERRVQDYAYAAEMFVDTVLVSSRSTLLRSTSVGDLRVIADQARRASPRSTDAAVSGDAWLCRRIPPATPVRRNAGDRSAEGLLPCPPTSSKTALHGECRLNIAALQTQFIRRFTDEMGRCSSRRYVDLLRAPVTLTYGATSAAFAVIVATSQPHKAVGKPMELIEAANYNRRNDESLGRPYGPTATACRRSLPRAYRYGRTA